MKRTYRSTKLERAVYKKALNQAVKDTLEKFPHFGEGNRKLDNEARAFRDQRLRDILLSSATPQVGALRIFEQQHPILKSAEHYEGRAIEKAGGLQALMTPSSLSKLPPPPPMPKSSLTPYRMPLLSERVVDDLLIGASAIAEFVGMSTWQVYHWHRTKKLPVGKVGGKLIASRTKLRRAFAELAK